jgi:hypothetical protein
VIALLLPEKYRSQLFRHFLKDNGKGENKLPEAYVLQARLENI